MAYRTQPDWSVKLYQKLTVLWGSCVNIVLPNLMAVGVGALLLVACSPADSKGVPVQTDAGEAIAAEVSADETVAAPAPTEFPVSYRGNWDYNENGCGEGESGTKFRITENQIIGYEDTSVLKSIEVLDDLAIRVVLENESSEGTHTLSQTMRLSPVAGISMRLERDGKTIRTLRCDPV